MVSSSQQLGPEDSRPGLGVEDVRWARGMALAGSVVRGGQVGALLAAEWLDIVVLAVVKAFHVAVWAARSSAPVVSAAVRRAPAGNGCRSVRAFPVASETSTLRVRSAATAGGP